MPITSRKTRGLDTATALRVAVAAVLHGEFHITPALRLAVIRPRTGPNQEKTYTYIRRQRRTKFKLS